ncbi:MAG: hypothetical protein J6Q76_01990 [Clostridia bacterium]|nr:hypothetical protein [Clostridia bacterium]
MKYNMEALRSVVASLCVSFVFFGVIMTLVPEGNMQKNIKTFVSVALVSVIVAVVSGVSSRISDNRFDLEFELDSTDVNSIVRSADEINITVTEDTVERLIFESLTEKEIKFFEISVSADISEDKSISITEVEIICPEGNGQKCRAVLSELGIKGTVTER